MGIWVISSSELLQRVLKKTVNILNNHFSKQMLENSQKQKDCTHISLI